MAVSTPYRALMPSCWLSPDSTPWKPIVIVFFPSDEDPSSLLPHAAAVNVTALARAIAPRSVRLAIHLLLPVPLPVPDPAWTTHGCGHGLLVCPADTHLRISAEMSAP